MDPPPHKRPRMGLLPQTQPQLGLNNLEALGVLPRFPILNLDHLAALQLALFLPSRLGPTVLAPVRTVRSKKPVAAVPQPSGGFVSSIQAKSPANVSPTPPKKTADDEGFTMTLSTAAYNYISKSDGVYFRNLVAQHLHVVATLDNPNADTLPTCKLKGPHGNLEKAKNAIQNFCDQHTGLRRQLKKRSLIPIFDREFTGLTTVQKNLDSLSSTGHFWFYKAILLHECIAHTIASIKDCTECEYQSCEERLKESYAKLNTILIVKLQDDEEAGRHMEILRQFLDRDFDDVKRSFNHVFNSDRRIFPDYDELMTQLANATTEEFRNPKILLRKICRMCRTCDWADDGRKMFCRYARIVIHNYQSEDVNIFRSEFLKIFQRYILQIRKHGKVQETTCPSTE
ncbi:uncharacterized protein LOC116180546 isoform X2 [Photinus pyralis]|nr:uncharacterized protein LOC116180546 isoform X2 [Photinus pyralis]